MIKENGLRDLFGLSRCTDSESNSPTLYTYKEEQRFYNKDPFQSQLQIVISGNNGSGKAKLLLNFYLKAI